MKTNKEIKHRLKDLQKEMAEKQKRWKRHFEEQDMHHVDILSRAVLELEWVLTNEKGDEE